jgi:hypothetical protein
MTPRSGRYPEEPLRCDFLCPAPREPLLTLLLGDDRSCHQKNNQSVSELDEECGT